jgi:protein gp37
MDGRFVDSEKMNVGRFGTGLPFKPGHRKDVEIFLDEKMLLQPLHWKRPRKIFVCSMTDLFGGFVRDEWIDKVFAVMALCPQHTFQVLTKRSKRMRKYMQPKTGIFGRVIHQAEKIRDMMRWPAVLYDMDFGNVWLGVSAEDQQRADERIPDLLATPAAIRFVSAEPLLDRLEISEYVRPTKIYEGGFTDDFDAPRLNWVICGGESGQNFRPMKIEWAERLMCQCDESADYFFKQDSGRHSGTRGRASDVLWACKEFPK